MKNITILGHQNPDVDSIVSGIILSQYLKYKGYNCSYVIPDKDIDIETSQILSKFGIDCNLYKNQIPKESLVILVDHHETVYDVDVVAVIDHHPTIKEFNYPIYINKKASSTSKLVYDIIKQEDENFLTKELIELIIVALLVDTCSFKSSKTNIDDIPWTQNICKDLNLDLEYLKTIGYCLTDLTDSSISSIHGFKEFKFIDKVVKTSYIQVEDFNFDIINDNINILKSKVREENIFMWVFIVVDIKHEKTLEYRIYSDKIDLVKHNFIASRGSNIMPTIELLINKKVEI